MTSTPDPARDKAPTMPAVEMIARMLDVIRDYPLAQMILRVAFDRLRTERDEAQALLTDRDAEILRLRAELEQAEVRAVAGIVGMDPARGRESVYAAVRDRLNDRRWALDEANRLRAKYEAATVVDDGRILRCSEEVAALVSRLTREREAMGGVVERARNVIAKHRCTEISRGNAPEMFALDGALVRLSTLTPAKE